MSKSLVFVDVGTHEAQEFAALFEHDRLTYLRRWLKSRRQAARAGSEKPTYLAFRKLLETVDGLRSKRHLIRYIMVEPNARLFSLPIYRKADLALNAALSSEKAGASLRPLFHAGDNPLGQGSSLFVEKPNVVTDQFDLVLCIDAKLFAEQLSRSLHQLNVPDNSPVVLRLNNEGAEVEVIQAFHDVFGLRLRLVMGSLNDVIKVKGQEAHDDLLAFLHDRGIQFVPFNSAYATWPKASDHLAELMAV